MTRAAASRAGGGPHAGDLARLRVRTAAPSYVVDAEAVRVGGDVLVWIWGGDRPHLGAVAAAQPRPSLADPARTSATASVLTFLGHKEDVVVKAVAEDLAAALGANVVVAAGIHWDGLGAEGVAVVLERTREITNLLKAGLAAGEGDGHD